MTDKRYTLIDNTQEKENDFDKKDKAIENKQLLEKMGHDVEIVDNLATDGGDNAEANNTTKDTPNAPKPTAGDIDALVQNPIDWLREKNDAYVNTVKGTPAISKRGFRYIQSKFEITTESEVAQWVDDPTGVIIWAKAELPDGRSAEAHGEGWQFEGSVDDNEFVRYADTRAKNRALADLTSSGALATEELK